jgi:vacuolar protein sorting-associated protein VTA1
MALSIPPELKKISAYIRRAEELDKDTVTPESRLVAYYCRQYAVHTGIPLASTSPAAKECLGALLGILEKEKPAMDNFTQEEAKFLCKSFADRVFAKADEEDRLGVANKNTAKTFYAAATFLQILEQFMEAGDPDFDEIKKQVVYSKWKSTEILKALKEGRSPTPGGYQEHQESEEMETEEKSTNEAPPKVEAVNEPPKVETVEEDDANANDVVVPTAPSPPPPPVTPMEPPASSAEEDAEDEGTEVQLGPPPSYPGEPAGSFSPPPVTFVAPPPPSPSPPPPESAPRAPSPPPPGQPQPKKSGGIFGFGKKAAAKPGKVTRAQLDDATELTRFALAALEDKDADLARTRLQQALQTLG